jgi:hypothetical protein
MYIQRTAYTRQDSGFLFSIERKKSMSGACAQDWIRTSTKMTDHRGQLARPARYCFSLPGIYIT